MTDRLTGAVSSVVGTVRRLVRLDATPDKRRQVFREEFGQNPPPYEATPTERQQFGREVVRPVLAQRDRALQQPVQDRGQQSAAQATRAAQT